MRTRKTILLIPIFLFFSALAFSQNDPRAEEILNSVNSTYKKMKSFQADFVNTQSDASDKPIGEKITGTITVKGNKYRIKTGGQEIFNNNKKVWTYLKSENEVTVENFKPDEGEINPAEIYKMYQKNFKYNFIEETRIGSEVCEVVDLTPTDRNRNFFKIRLTIAQKTRLVKSWRIFEKSGRRYDYSVANFKQDLNLDDKHFEFDKKQYPNVEVVEL